MNTKKQIVVIGNLDTMEYFFSKDHCQDHGMGKSWVPCTHYVPTCVAARPSVPDGIVKNINDIVAVFYDDMKEIPNPDSNMQP